MAVHMLQERLSVSERRACQIAGQHRSTQRHRPRKTDRDDALRAELRSLSRCRPRWGYRRAWASLRSEGWEANRKKIQRLWREEGLRVPARRRKRYRLGTSTTQAARLRAERPDQVWALDFQFDTTSDGRILKLMHVVDEHTREALAIEVARRIDADRTVSVLERIVAERGRPPELVRMDNGPELTGMPCATGVASAAATARTSSRAHPGRTRSWNPSPARSETRCSRWRPSTR
jgi:transposase InsO family protein